MENKRGDSDADTRVGESTRAPKGKRSLVAPEGEERSKGTCSKAARHSGGFRVHEAEPAGPALAEPGPKGNSEAGARACRGQPPAADSHSTSNSASASSNSGAAGARKEPPSSENSEVQGGCKRHKAEALSTASGTEQRERSLELTRDAAARAEVDELNARP